MRRPNKKQPKGSPRWMTTYSDMITLILVFFILLFSMSQIDLVKFEAVAESFRNRVIFDHYPSTIPMEHPSESPELREGSKDFRENFFDREDDGDLSEYEVNDAESLDDLLAEIQAFLRENDLENDITANRSEQGVVLILQERILFDSGEANIKPSGEPFLDQVGLLLKNLPNKVRVEGHTDNRPISTMQFPSNWELSAGRASSVIRHILESNDLEENRFIAVGYSDTRPIVENDSPENWSKNRRVEIVILELSQDFH